MAININLDSTSNVPHASVPRQMGKVNLGVYCETCEEFFALAVTDQPMFSKGVKIVAAGPVLLKCTECGHEQRRNVSDIVELTLRQTNRRKAPRPPHTHV
jgi:RNase P subunit RPR2